ERTRQPEERGKDQRRPEQPARGDVARAGRQGEVEDRERRDDEEEHRRQRLLRAQLQQQILARKRCDVRRVAHANASLSVANSSTRSGSWVATTSVRSSPRTPSSSTAPSTSSALYGSSSPRCEGSCSSTRHNPSRCCIPRENVETRS